jgi:fumarate hydratase subunit beta
MDKIKHIQAPLDEEAIASLKAGDEVLLSGTILTARDQAHSRLFKMMGAGEKLPVDLKSQVIYYCGPTPPCGRPIGSCGPTTSGRMDVFTPRLLEAGMKGMIGKGRRSGEVVAALKRTKAVYFVAPAGAGAYLSEKVEASEVITFKDLGPEAIYRLEVKDFPLIVAIDCEGRNIYDKM